MNKLISLVFRQIAGLVGYFENRFLVRHKILIFIQRFLLRGLTVGSNRTISIKTAQAPPPPPLGSINALNVRILNWIFHSKFQNFVRKFNVWLDNTLWLRERIDACCTHCYIYHIRSDVCSFVVLSNQTFEIWICIHFKNWIFERSFEISNGG